MSSDGVSTTAIGDFLILLRLYIAVIVMFNSVDFENHKSRYFIVAGVIASAVAVLLTVLIGGGVLLKKGKSY